MQFVFGSNVCISSSMFKYVVALHFKCVKCSVAIHLECFLASILVALLLGQSKL